MEKLEFEKIYDAYAGKLYNFIVWTTGNRTVGDDVLQNVFIKIWRCEAVPLEQNGLTPWLYTIARNACLDYFRTIKKSSEYDDEYAGHAPPRSDCADRTDDGKLAWHEVTQLPETERSILYLHLKAGYSYGEIGTLLDMTENNIRVKAFRALRKLRDILTKKGL